MDEVDIRNVKHTIARLKSRDRAQQQKAREELRQHKRNFPELFPNGYFKEPVAQPVEQGANAYDPRSQFTKADDDTLVAWLIDAPVEVLRDLVQGGPLDHGIFDAAFRLNIAQFGENGPAWRLRILDRMRFLLLSPQVRAHIDEMRLTPESDEFVKAAPFIDAHWSEQNSIEPRKDWKPSTLIAILFYWWSSGEDVWPDEGRHERARQHLREMINSARERYRQGYYANPLGEPILR